MHRAHYPQTDADRIYILSNNGVRERISVEYYVTIETEPEQLRRKQQ